jgi:hypothetical protein
VKFIPYKVDGASGVSVQLTVADVTGDGVPDILTVSKLGAFLFSTERLPPSQENQESLTSGPGRHRVPGS